MQWLKAEVGDSVSYLADLSADDLARLKITIKDQRQSAKALNFWLLNFMSEEILCEVAAEKREILNYSDQGSGADIALLAPVEIKHIFKAMVVNIIHDELMLEGPDAMVE